MELDSRHFSIYTEMSPRTKYTTLSGNPYYVEGHLALPISYTSKASNTPIAMGTVKTKPQQTSKISLHGQHLPKTITLWNT